MHTETVIIGEEYGEEYAGKYVFQELTWAKRSRIIQKHTKYHPLTGQVVAADYVAIQAETIIASLKEQPPHKPITLEKLLSEDPANGVPIALGELFSQIVNRLNNLSHEETAFLYGQSDGKSHAQPSQSSASVKSSDGRQNSLPNNQPKQYSNSSPS
ncbi:hypothetical protein KEJ24_00505 [Candidatus Bathyarchaeota archaeon]|nr:hypothetical protein [Candidatus Bathyarchaeota archaeon]